MNKPKGLGRGLDALLGSDSSARKDALATLPVEAIQPGKYQPRTHMDEKALAELAASIRAQGLMQPLLVRPLGAPHERGRYELIAGERRWRAAQIAGLSEVPVLVREVPDNAALAMALIENIQREDLNPIEAATGLQRLVDEFRMTHEQAADAIGRSRSATTNLLRLLKLAKPVQALLMQGALEMGHARALLAVNPARQAELAHQIIGRGLSVREAEQLVGRAEVGARKTPRKQKKDRDLQALEEELSETLGAAISINTSRGGKGKLVINYSSLDQLDEILVRLRG